MKDGEVGYIKSARFLFPFDKELLVSEALLNIRSKRTDKNTYYLLKAALYYDPYSIEMLGMYIQFENAYGSKEKAQNSFNLLKQIGSNTNTFKQLKNLPTMKGF